MAQARRKGIANSRYINEFMKLNTRREKDKAHERAKTEAASSERPAGS